MGCGSDKSGKTRAKEIERILKKDFSDGKHELKLLLLGTGESGKSTIIKQMRIIYGKGFTPEDRAEFAVLVYRNVLRSVKAMVDAMDVLNIPFGDKSLQDGAYALLDTAEDTYMDLKPHYELVTKLWADSGIQLAFGRRNEYQLSDSTPYYLEPQTLARVTQPDYIPDEQDILRAREPTTGIHEYLFILEKAVFRMLDVGGQRSERRKWIHCFENITSIVFIVACSEYDQMLVEESDCNRMLESTALFEQIINYHWFRDTSFILFLNKRDLLDIKVKTSNIKDYFPKYTGDSKDPEAVAEFIATMYLERKPAGHDVFKHFTTATDTGNIKRVFDDVKATLVRLHLKDYNLF